MRIISILGAACGRSPTKAFSFFPPENCCWSSKTANTPASGYTEIPHSCRHYLSTSKAWQACGLESLLSTERTEMNDGKERNAFH